MMREERVRDQCLSLKAEKAVVRSVYSHCLIHDHRTGKTQVLFRSEQGEGEPTNALQQKKF